MRFKYLVGIVAASLVIGKCLASNKAKVAVDILDNDPDYILINVDEKEYSGFLYLKDSVDVDLFSLADKLEELRKTKEDSEIKIIFYSKTGFLSEQAKDYFRNEGIVNAYNAGSFIELKLEIEKRHHS